MSRIRTWFIRLVLLALASAAPNAFPLSQMGYGTLHHLALVLILPSVAALLVAWLLLEWRGPRSIAALLLGGAVAGAAATLALEAVRYPGFRLGFMPGNLPRLMGVLLLDRFALGPSTLSDAAGFAYHAWNGASFGIVFTMLAKGRSSWWAVPFGLLVGLGFLASPVVLALGVGPFGRDFGWQFAATVLAAHAAFGLALALLVGPLTQHYVGRDGSPVSPKALDR
ncbi:MAG: hypothetical protein A3H96_01825 [Acidobacteria bacterium RIFCSPLOWO2_02_FULL_67_36]|nr:MAG: hypothetical protein A3H96_01825 [Acidobacteria bacterium RIFCSPLOWO2_02_FULL_67_36]OFW22730.1 MAG: hypothetical protein A3G21_25900 [Acidobacteria bacterium RIFCSPLOWO2_12_FULL_66_21]